jgi:hypothetical protein
MFRKRWFKVQCSEFKGMRRGDRAIVIVFWSVLVLQNQAEILILDSTLNLEHGTLNEPYPRGSVQ